MPSIGPQLPAHLQKRKRTPESHAGRDSPPSKVTRRPNDEEIALDDGSSDDGFGPSVGRPGPTMLTSGPVNSSSKAADTEATARPRPSIGPSMPPTPGNEDEISLDDGEDDDGMGPTMPSAPASRAPAPAPKRIIGPAPPPNNLSERPTTDPNPDPDPDSDSDSDSDYGPALPTAGSSHRTAPSVPLPSAAPEAPKRDDWMLAPAAPTSRATAAADPTKLRARKFASGRAAAASESHAGGISSIWTETPEEKRQRLADAVLGRGGEGEGSSARRKDKKDSKGARGNGSGGGGADADKIRSYTEQTRGKSLYEQHQVRRKVAKEGADDGEGAELEEEDDPSKRAFNWEKDMKAGSTISHSQRRQLLTKSANFGGRFEKGSYL